MWICVAVACVERWAIQVPSRDQTAELSSAGSKVKRELVPCLRSLSQIFTSFAFASETSTATLLLSGERVGFAISPTSPKWPSSFPARSYQVRTDSPAPTVGL